MNESRSPFRAGHVMRSVDGLKLFPAPEETIAGIGREIRKGQRSCVQVVEACLDRIDSLESDVQAWVCLDRDGASAQARTLDQELASGSPRGPLHGIPVGIKDIVDVAGLPTAAGSRRWGDRVATRDATLVARLRQAGAVILGKTVTTPYAGFDPSKTRNPWNLDRTPAGSSSGSAAAVACGMCPGAVGSQTGGSINRPAAYCGVAGCKPTYGRVSLFGVLPLAPSLDHPGPLARSVEDLAILLDAMAGPDPNDPNCLRESPTPIAPCLEAGLSTAPRLGRLGGMFADRAESSVRHAMDLAVAALEAAGAVLREPAMPSRFDDVLPCHRTIMAVEAAAEHERRLADVPDDYPVNIRSLIEEGLAVTATEYARCRHHHIALGHEMAAVFADVDALIAPAATGPAGDTSTTGDPAFNSPWSYTRLPTVSFPMGLSPDGLPLALQVIGRPQGEANLFRVAAWCETVCAAAL